MLPRRTERPGGFERPNLPHLKSKTAGKAVTRWTFDTQRPSRCHLSPCHPLPKMSERFFSATSLTADTASLTGPEAHHLAHVVRAAPGTEVVLFDGTGI